MIGWLIPTTHGFEEYQRDLSDAISEAVREGLQKGGEVAALEAIAQKMQEKESSIENGPIGVSFEPNETENSLPDEGTHSPAVVMSIVVDLGLEGERY